jgi:tetratricopeptide (TPR) repeat protein
MFKINIYLKFVIIAIGLGGGIVLALMYGFVYSWPLILVGVIFLLSYILLGTIQSAGEKVQLMDFNGAEKQLNLTFFPRLLYVTNRAIFYVLRGTIAAHRGENNTAENYFNIALSMNLPSDNEKAMVLLQMAGIHAKKNNWSSAKTYLNQAKKLNITEPMILNQFKEFDKAVNGRGQMNVARSMGKEGMKMMRQGGYSHKRRRPKMR